MKRMRICLALLLSAALPAFSILGQQNKNAEQVQPDSNSQILSVNVDLVNVIFTVADKSGKLVTRLPKENFKVLEDDKQQTISNFSNETNLPLSVALVFDTSTSILGRLKFEQDAAGEFFYTTLRRGTDKALVITFDKTIALAQDFTDDKDLLTKAIGKVRAGGSTPMFDAAYLAMTKKLIGQPGRHVIIVISDGDDNASERSIDETIAMAQKTDTVIYAVGTSSPELFGSTKERGNKFLKRLADETGGRLFLPTKVEDLTKSLLEISEELRSQYTLGYRSTNTNRDGSYRKIRISVSDKQYRVRARDGYYASRASAK
jgi:Ca-activated chloride channel family protein